MPVLDHAHARQAAATDPFLRASGLRVRQDGHALHLVIDRPTHLNALDHGTVLQLRAAFDDAVEDPGIGLVVLTGAGRRGLSAGGDLRFLLADGESDGRQAPGYWADLYGLALAIAESPLPVLAIMDGFAFGGALGLAVQADHRVVTERSEVGMPETRLGFFPDTGGLTFLADCPGEIGTHLALTATTVGAADAIGAGLADHLVASRDLPTLLNRVAIRPVTEAIADVAVYPGPPTLERAWIDDCYRGDSVEEILTRLREHGSPAAEAAAGLLATRSPTAVAITLGGLRRGRGRELSSELTAEHRLATWLHRRGDFLEGIRARLVERRPPRWAPLDDDLVEATLATL